MEPDRVRTGCRGHGDRCPARRPVRRRRDAIAREGAAAHVRVRTSGESFEAFWQRERASVGRALAVTIGDIQLAAEATDEAMARAYEHWAKVSAVDSPAGWVYRVGLNWSRSVLRRLRRTPPTWLAQAATHHDQYGPDPSVAAAMLRVLAQRSARQVAVCRLLLGLSEAQTATALRLQPGTVKSRLSRALRSLQTSSPTSTPRSPCHEPLRRPLPRAR